MSKNRHAYKDYHGPRLPGCKIQHPAKPEPDNDDEEEHPLRGLVWAEGDSLAPPCGSSVPLIHAMLEFASVDQDDMLYDVSFACCLLLLIPEFSKISSTFLHVLSLDGMW